MESKPKKKGFFSKLINKLPRYQKIVTTFLYATVLFVVGYTFWEFNYVGESVNPEIYGKTMDVLLGLLGVTGGLKITEGITDTARDIVALKTSNSAVNMRGGE